MSKALVQRLLKQKKIKGHIQRGKQGGTIPSELDGYSAQLAQMVTNIQMPPDQNTVNIGDKLTING